MTKQTKRAMEGIAAILVIANVAYFAADWNATHLHTILVSALTIAVAAVFIVRYLPTLVRGLVRQELARERVLDGVETRAEANTSHIEFGDGVIPFGQRRDLSS